MYIKKTTLLKLSKWKIKAYVVADIEIIYILQQELYDPSNMIVTAERVGNLYRELLL